jgi:hypothetical protein
MPATQPVPPSQESTDIQRSADIARNLREVFIAQMLHGLYCHCCGHCHENVYRCNGKVVLPTAVSECENVFCRTCILRLISKCQTKPENQHIDPGHFEIYRAGLGAVDWKCPQCLGECDCSRCNREHTKRVFAESALVSTVTPEVLPTLTVNINTQRIIEQSPVL